MLTKNKKSLFIIAAFIGAILLFFIFSNGNGKIKGSESEVSHDSNVQTSKEFESNDDRLKREEEERIPIDELYKDADEVVFKYLVAKKEEDNPTFLSLLVEGTKGYEEFKNNTRNIDAHVNPGTFESSVYSYSYKRFSSEFEDSNKLYYEYDYRSIGKAISFKNNEFQSGHLVLTKDDQGSWLIESYGLEAMQAIPDSLDKYGSSVSVIAFHDEELLNKDRK